MLKKLKKIHSKIDLSKKYPNYINKPVFWIGFLSILGLVGFAVFLYGFNTKFYNIECNDEKGCLNPFVSCKNSFYNPYCEFINKLECKGINCDVAQIQKGEYIGTKPPYVVENFNFLVFSILVFTFAINQIIYWRKQ
jgi:hypothetical protein